MTFEDLKLKVKQKALDAKSYVKQGVGDALYWVTTHPYEAAIVTTAFGYGAKIAIKAIGAAKTNATIAAEQAHRDYDIYDHSTGAYFHCKRKLTNADLIQLDALRDDGFSKAEALRKMKLI